jgi:hypothetical protein
MEGETGGYDRGRREKSEGREVEWEVEEKQTSK